MVKKNPEISFYVGEQYRIISEFADKVGEYKSFKEKYDELISKGNVNKEEWDKFLKKYHSKVLLDVSNRFLGGIANIKKSTESFSKQKQDLTNIKKKLEINELSLLELNKVRGEIKKIQEELIEKENIVKYNKKQLFFWAIIGFLLGMLAEFLFDFIKNLT